MATDRKKTEIGVHVRCQVIQYLAISHLDSAETSRSPGRWGDTTDEVNIRAMMTLDMRLLAPNHPNEECILLLSLWVTHVWDEIRLQCDSAKCACAGS